MSSMRKHLTPAFVAAVVAMATLFFVVTGGTAFFLASKQNQNAQAAAKKMMTMGIDNVVDTLDGFAFDYSAWDIAVVHLNAKHYDWIIPNIASSIETGIFDLMGVLQGNGDQYGWIDSTDTAVQTDLFSDERIARFRAAKDFERPRTPLSFFDEYAGELWLFSLMHAQNYEVGVPLNERDNPLIVYGRRVDDALISQVADAVLIDGVGLASDPSAARPENSLVLDGLAGAPHAAVTWTPPKPGTEILREWRAEAIGVIVLVLAVTFALGWFLIWSAARLRAAMDVANAANRAKTLLLANISHELRTPMNGILGAAQLLRDADLSSDDRDLLDMIEMSAASQIELIQDLIDIAKLDIAKTQPDLMPVDIASMIRSQIRAARVLAGQKGLEVELEMDTEMPGLLQDEKLLRQILTNLLSNATKFTAQGKIGLIAGWTPAADDAERGTFKMTVWDTGVGIDPSQTTRIFDRFYQADMSETRDFAGSGLGLSIVQALVQALGGRITVESDLGKGSQFTVTLPSRIATQVAQDDNDRMAA